MSEKEFLKQMGAKIRKARNKKGIYLRDLGKEIKMHYGSLSMIENGLNNAHVLTLKKLAEALDVDVKYFL